MYIPHVPGVAREDTVALAARLKKEDMDPVPHIVARRTESAAVLDDFLTRLVGEAGVTRVLCVAGDISTPEGEFDSALQILERGFLEKHGIKKIGVAGHPEGHKDVTETALKDAIVRKNAYAQKTGADLRLVTQFSFVAEPVIAWEKTLAPHQQAAGLRRAAGPREGEHAAEVRARLRRRSVAAGVLEARDATEQAADSVGAGRAARRAGQPSAAESRRVRSRDSTSFRSAVSSARPSG